MHNIRLIHVGSLESEYREKIDFNSFLKNFQDFAIYENILHFGNWYVAIKIISVHFPKSRREKKNIGFFFHEI